MLSRNCMSHQCSSTLYHRDGCVSRGPLAGCPPTPVITVFLFLRASEAAPANIFRANKENTNPSTRSYLLNTLAILLTQPSQESLMKSSRIPVSPSDLEAWGLHAVLSVISSPCATSSGEESQRTLKQRWRRRGKRKGIQAQVLAAD